MQRKWYQILGAVVISAVLAVSLCIPLPFLLIAVMMSGGKVYLIAPLAVLYLALLPLPIMAIQGWLTPVRKRWLQRGWLCVLALCVLYGGWSVYEEGIPTVDDRSLLLHEYQPFAQDTKAVRLEGAAALQLEWGELPCLDGATALYPVYAAFVQAVYPQQNYPLHGTASPGYGTVNCNGTVAVYERLIRGETDMIFAAGPSTYQQQLAKQAGVTLHMTPIGKEAFVFFVNSKNPVTGLTVEQVQGIYSGEITNWSQVGGQLARIRAFQRAENSGSQTALQNLMGDIPLMEPEKQNRISAMDGIIHEVAGYRNLKNAIGFSFRFYASEMEASDQIRLLALDGVAPTQETIRDGSYPISSAFYAVTASPEGQSAPETENPALGALLAWILSEEGQLLVEKTGYVAIS